MNWSILYLNEDGETVAHESAEERPSLAQLKEGLNRHFERALDDTEYVLLLSESFRSVYAFVHHMPSGTTSGAAIVYPKGDTIEQMPPRVLRRVVLNPPSTHGG